MFGLSILEKVIIGAVVALAIGGAVVAFIHHQRAIGAEAEHQKQVDANAQFNRAVRSGASAFDACDLANGVYDFRSSTCKFR